MIGATVKSFIKDRKFSISVTLLNFVGIIVLIILGENLEVWKPHL